MYLEYGLKIIKASQVIIHIPTYTLYYFNYKKCLWHTSDSRDNAYLYSLFGKFIDMDLKTLINDERFENYLPELKVVKASLNKALKMDIILKIAKKHWIKDNFNPYEYFNQNIHFLSLSGCRIFDLKTLKERKRTPKDRWTFKVDMELKKSALVRMDTFDWNDPDAVFNFIFKNP